MKYYYLLISTILVVGTAHAGIELKFDKAMIGELKDFHSRKNAIEFALANEGNSEVLKKVLVARKEAERKAENNDPKWVNVLSNYDLIIDILNGYRGSTVVAGSIPVR